MIHDVAAQTIARYTSATAIKGTIVLQIINAFEQLVARAAAEHAHTAARVADIEHLLAEARRCRADRDATRARLADALELATVAADAAATRLGAVRGSVADATRALEECADLAADGDQAAARPIAKMADALATQRELLAAHQRRASALAETRDAAERALSRHDAADVDEEGRGLEQLMTSLAGEVDCLLSAVNNRAEQIFSAFDARRSLRPVEPWPIPCNHETNRFPVVLAAFERATWPINPSRRAVGPTGAKTLTDTVAIITSCWAQGRGEFPTQPDQAA